MTEAQMLRQERRAIVARRQHERRVQDAKDAVGFLLFMALLLLAFTLAGTLDYQDRVQGLGANMMPSPAWAEGESR